MKVALIVGTSVATVGAVAAAGVVSFKAYRDSHNVPADEQTASVLKGNEKLFNRKELALIKALLERSQAHLFAAWPAPGTQDELKRKLVAQLVALDTHYHGGLSAYIDNAKQLLRDSKEGRNPFEGYTPSVPHGEKLDFGSDDFQMLEKEGLTQAGSTAFVLVAGGLGERLGYSGIKVALPCESATSTCFLELYARYIKALEVASGTKKHLPFAIMTSDDTHDKTVKLLEAHKYFGLQKSQVHLMKQEKVACLIDNDAALALEPKDSYQVQTKPHGHGDVHALLHSTGLASKWHNQGFKWVAFFQDTNAQVFRALTAALGVSARHEYDMNSLAVPRKAKESIGAIASLKHTSGRLLTINVEYNQLDPLLRGTISPEGDVNDASGYSPFPGNINQLIIKLDSYTELLHRTGGIISEFVNPKYKDASKTAFKSSTRLECMMQDYPKALPDSAKVGFTTINQVWASYSPVKNNPADAQAKAKEGNPTHSATIAELDIYRTNCHMLSQLTGAQVAKPQPATFNGIPCEQYPAVVLSPEWAITLADVQSKVQPGSINLGPGAVLVLDGADISIEGPLKVEGALLIKAVKGAHVKVHSLSVSNKGWRWQPLPEGPEGQAAPEEERIRGFHVVKDETAEYVFDKPGEYVVGERAAPSKQEATKALDAPAAAALAAATPAAAEPAASPAATPAAPAQPAAPAAAAAEPPAKKAETPAPAPATPAPAPTPTPTPTPASKPSAPAADAATPAPAATADAAPTKVADVPKVKAPELKTDAPATETVAAPSTETSTAASEAAPAASQTATDTSKTVPASGAAAAEEVFAAAAKDLPAAAPTRADDKAADKAPVDPASVPHALASMLTGDATPAGGNNSNNGNNGGTVAGVEEGEGEADEGEEEEEASAAGATAEGTASAPKKKKKNKKKKKAGAAAK